MRAPCCKRWFDCPQCHAEAADHELLKTMEIVMACKKCSKVFRKDSSRQLDESDEYCPHCDNHYVIAAIEPTPFITVESNDPRFLQKDQRMKASAIDLHEDELLDLMNC